jgi:hypothetical protein
VMSDYCETLPLTYLWSGPGVNGATTSSVNVNQLGTYSVTVTAVGSGCPPWTASFEVKACPQ